MAFRTNKMPVLQEKSASGAVATFNTALAMPLPSCNIAVNAWQEGTGDPSPSNVRPIHGFSEVNVTANEVVHTIQLGQEVYGAEVDVNGVAHCTRIKKVIDETSGVIRASNGILYLDNFFDIPEDTRSVKCNCYTRGTNRSNVAQTMELNPNYSFCCKTGGTPNRVMIKDTRFNTIEEFNEWVALNPISVLIMLAEPFDIQLTPTQIETIAGKTNTIFADTGDIDLTYKDLDIAKRGNFREVFRLPS